MAAKYRDIQLTDWAWMNDLDGRSRNVLITALNGNCQTKQQIAHDLRMKGIVRLRDLSNCGISTEYRIKKWLGTEDHSAAAQLQKAIGLVKAHGYTVVAPPMNHLETYR